MPSEAPAAAESHRLHPASILFWLSGQVRRLVLPLVVGGVSASRWGLGWEAAVGLLLLPITLYSVVRYATFRYRFERNDLVVRTGLLFRQERTIPYARIQNLDAVQGPLQRLLDVVEVQIQTGGGREAEASLNAVPASAVPELRRHVFAGREATADRLAPPGGPADDESREASGEPAGVPLLHLPVRELLLYGLIQNRGMIVIAAGMGLAWEVGLMEAIAEGAAASPWLRELLRDVTGVAGPLAAMAALGLLTVAVLGFLAFARLLSVAWALVRLHDFTIASSGEDLRTTFGLLTRVSATIPLRRIQKLTIHEGPLHRLAGRTAVRVDTAGGRRREEGDEAHRQWLAPLIRRERLPDFVAEIMPELDFGAVQWEPVASGAFRRVLVVAGWIALAASVTSFLTLGVAAAPLAAGFVAAAIFYARKYTEHLGWAVTRGSVLFRSGWLWRRVSVARFAKIQAVEVRATPFDRRLDMARVRVDTAGAGAASHSVHIPYLAAPRAYELGQALTAEAATTTFRW